jgi:hypothetical protein
MERKSIQSRAFNRPAVRSQLKRRHQMDALFTHCGAEKLTRDQLATIPTPEGTDKLGAFLQLGAGEPRFVTSTQHEALRN